LETVYSMCCGDTAAYLRVEEAEEYSDQEPLQGRHKQLQIHVIAVLLRLVIG